MAREKFPCGNKPEVDPDFRGRSTALSGWGLKEIEVMQRETEKKEIEIQPERQTGQSELQR